MVRRNVASPVWCQTSAAVRHHQFAAHGAVLHRLVGLDDLSEPEDVANRHRGPAGFDIVDEALQDRLREISFVSAVGGQPDAAWDVVDRVELLDRPLVGEHPGEARHTMDRTQPSVSGRVGVPTSSRAASTPSG